MTTYTELEQQLLIACVAFWNYGDESEKDDNAVCFNASDLAKETGLPVATVKGGMGSLTKKGLFAPIETSRNTLESGVTDEGIDAALQFKRGGVMPIAD